MSIRMMTSADRADQPNVETVTGYCGHEGPLYMETTYVGATLAVWEANHYDDSDFYASVWDGEAVVTVEYATTRGWTYPNHAVVDATPEVVAAASAWMNARLSRFAADRATAEARVPKVGSIVRVVRGRKVALGTTGTVTWVGKDQYKTTRWTTVYRVGIRPDDVPTDSRSYRDLYLAMANVEVVDPPTYTAADFPMTGTPSFARPDEVAFYSAMAIANAESRVTVR